MCYNLKEVKNMIKKTLSKKIFITRNIRDPKLSMPYSHYHDGYEIFFLTKGNIRYLINNKIFDLSPGDIMLIPPNSLHKTTVTSDFPTERLLIDFTADFLKKDTDDPVFKCFKNYLVENPHEYAEDIKKIEEESLKKDEYTDEFIRCFLTTFLIKLSRASSQIKNQPSSSPFVGKIINYINLNFAGDLSLKLLADEFSISKNYLSKLFKTETGIGINDYINLVRIKNAEHILMFTNNTVLEVATTCGFHDSNYFSTVFKKINGLSPLQYRKSEKNKKA